MITIDFSVPNCPLRRKPIYLLMPHRGWSEDMRRSPRALLSTLVLTTQCCYQQGLSSVPTLLHLWQNKLASPRLGSSGEYMADHSGDAQMLVIMGSRGWQASQQTPDLSLAWGQRAGLKHHCGRLRVSHANPSWVLFIHPLIGLSLLPLDL